MSAPNPQHDSIPFPSVDAKTIQRNAIPPRNNKLTIVPPDSNPETFWAELNRTLDEFFHTIDASKEHIRELTERVAERDKTIELLESEIAALRDQAEMRQLAESKPAAPEPVPQSKPVPAPAPSAVISRSTEPSPADDARGGIWRRLLHVEREISEDVDE